MKYERTTIPQEEIEKQLSICHKLFDRVTADGARPLAMVDTYGCQQNESDSEVLRGFLREMGYTLTDDEQRAAALRGAGEGEQLPLRGGEQRAAREEVAARVAGHGELREDGDRGALRLGLAVELEDPGGVEGGVPDADERQVGVVVDKLDRAVVEHVLVVLADADVAGVRDAMRACEDAPLANHDARPRRTVRASDPWATDIWLSR